MHQKHTTAKTKPTS